MQLGNTQLEQLKARTHHTCSCLPDLPSGDTQTGPYVAGHASASSVSGFRCPRVMMMIIVCVPLLVIGEGDGHEAIWRPGIVWVSTAVKQLHPKF